MEEGKALFKEVVSEDYDAADRPFDFVEEGDTTALVCESDPAVREKISGILKELGYRITESTVAKDALKAMRFHVFDVVILNELFDSADPQANSVLLYLEEMPMTTRMSCSMSRMVMPSSSRSRLMKRVMSAVSCGFIPAVGSSRSSRRGLLARARAISRRRCRP